MSYAIKKYHSINQWDAFVSQSPQGSVFCLSAFLNALLVEWEGIFITENGVPLMGAVLLMKEGKVLKAPYPFTIYQGVMLDGSFATMPHHRRSKLIPELEEFLLAHLSVRYEQLSFCMHHAFEDLRGFQWFNYHNNGGGQFSFDLRYTGLIDLKNYLTLDDYVACIRSVRRQEYRKGLNGNFTIETSNDVDCFDELHRKTFERQGIERSAQEALLFRSITRAMLESGMGELLFCRTPTGEVASATLFLYDRKAGYNLYTANDPVFRKTGCSTFLMVENFMRCKQKKLEWLDVVGINSPQRGDFKTSMNARPVPYFIITWKK